MKKTLLIAGCVAFSSLLFSCTKKEETNNNANNSTQQDDAKKAEEKKGLDFNNFMAMFKKPAAFSELGAGASIQDVQASNFGFLEAALGKKPFENEGSKIRTAGKWQFGSTYMAITSELLPNNEDFVVTAYLFSEKGDLSDSKVIGYSKNAGVNFMMCSFVESNGAFSLTVSEATKNAKASEAKGTRAKYEISAEGKFKELEKKEYKEAIEG